MSERQTFPEEMRELRGATDITTKIIAGMEELFDRDIDIDWKEVYEDFWRQKGVHNPDTLSEIALAINPEDAGTTGRKTKTRNPLGPGPLSSPTNVTRLGRIESRGFAISTTSAELKNAGYPIIYIKGTGVSMVINPSEENAIASQFSRTLSIKNVAERSWASLGGALLNFAETDFNIALLLTAVHRALYGEHADVRMPLIIVDITEALKKEGAPNNIEPHCQVQYPVRTTVRSSYNYYLQRLTEFWIDLDLHDDKQKKKAMDRLNTMLMAHPSRYSQNIQSLTEQEILSVAKEDKNIFTLIEAYAEAMAGDAELERYSQAEIELQVVLRYQMAQVGHEIARLFYEKNAETIQKMIVTEATKLGRSVGIALALGIEDDGFPSSKDTYGGMISDFDGCEIVFTNNRIDLSSVKEKDMLNKGYKSVLSFLELHGVPRENMRSAIVAYLQAIATTVKRIRYDSLDTLPFSVEYKQQIENLYDSRVRKLPTNALITGDDWLRQFIFTACEGSDMKINITLRDRTMLQNAAHYEIPTTNIVPEQQPLKITLTTRNILS